MKESLPRRRVIGASVGAAALLTVALGVLKMWTDNELLAYSGAFMVALLPSLILIGFARRRRGRGSKTNESSVAKPRP